MQKIAAFVISTFLLVSMSWAQNYNLLEEEAAKDKERQEVIRLRMQDLQKEQEAILAEPVTEKEIQEKQLVEVEPNFILPSDLASAYALVPYRVRRPKWGIDAGFTYSQYHPVNYSSDYFDPTLANFDDLYGSAQTNLMELYFNYKRNFFLGSVGLEAGIGTYKNKAESNLISGADLALTMGRVGVKYIADNIFPEPYISPYASLGVYAVQYKETLATATLDGTTGPAVYYTIGSMFQLNWLDPRSAVESYVESGIENTFVFIEMRQYLASAADIDPDFSTEMDINFGLSVEF